MEALQNGTDPSDDPQYFEQSSYEDYDRHHYKVVGKNGEYCSRRLYVSTKIWWNRKVFLSHIEVLDKPKESKGFKMKIEIELSKNVDYPGEKLGEYIWNLKEGDNHITGFCDSIGRYFEEIIRHR